MNQLISYGVNGNHRHLGGVMSEFTTAKTNMCTNGLDVLRCIISMLLMCVVNEKNHIRKHHAE